MELVTVKVVWEHTKHPMDVIKSSQLARALRGVQHDLLYWNCYANDASYFVFCLDEKEKLALWTTLALYSHMVTNMIFSVKDGIEELEVK